MAFFVEVFPAFSRLNLDIALSMGGYVLVPSPSASTATLVSRRSWVVSQAGVDGFCVTWASRAFDSSLCMEDVLPRQLPA